MSNDIDTLKNMLVKLKIQQAENEIHWKNPKDELTKVGLQVAFQKAYKIKIDDNGEPFPTDYGGDRIPHPVIAGSYLGVTELYKQFAIDSKAAIDSATPKKTVSRIADNTQVSVTCRPRTIAAPIKPNIARFE